VGQAPKGPPQDGHLLGQQGRAYRGHRCCWRHTGRARGWGSCRPACARQSVRPTVSQSTRPAVSQSARPAIMQSARPTVSQSARQSPSHAIDRTFEPPAVCCRPDAAHGTTWACVGMHNSNATAWLGGAPRCGWCTCARRGRAGSAANVLTAPCCTPARLPAAPLHGPLLHPGAHQGSANTGSVGMHVFVAAQPGC
jgi:hypothetical protein